MDLVKEIKTKAYDENIPVMKDDGMSFLLSFLEDHTEIRDILEVGTAVGLSAIQMAEVRWDMKIDTLEIDPVMVQKAKENIRSLGLENRITVYLCDGADFMTEKEYDLIFIDAAKSQYRRYLEHFMNNAHQGTYFVFDNLNFHGIVDNNSLSQNRSTIQMVHKIEKFRNELLNDKRLETIFYKDIGDGIAIAKTKQEGKNI